MPNTRAACRWLIPSTWQARRTRAYRSTAFISHAFRPQPGRKAAGRRSDFAPPQPDYPAASVREFLSAALTGAAPGEGGVVGHADLQAEQGGQRAQQAF